MPLLGNPDTRPLPAGWVSEYDSSRNAWYYVNTRVHPPLSTWEHPLDSQPQPPSYAPPPTSPPVAHSNSAGSGYGGYSTGQGSPGYGGYPASSGGAHGQGAPSYGNPTLGSGRGSYSSGTYPTSANAYGYNNTPGSASSQTSLGSPQQSSPNRPAATPAATYPSSTRPAPYSGHGTSFNSSPTPPYPQNPQYTSPQQATWQGGPNQPYPAVNQQPGYAGYGAGQPISDNRQMQPPYGYQQPLQQQPMYMQQPNTSRRGGGMGMGTVAAIGAGGLIAGGLLGAAVEDSRDDAYRDGYQDGQQNDFGGYGDYGGDDF